MTDLYTFLEENHIEYERHDHPPVYTVEDVKKLVTELPATRTKNLFLRDNKGKKHFLVLVKDEKKVDLKQLHKVIGSTRLSFGSPDRLKKHLGVDPGAVSLFAILNDTDHNVQVFMDSPLWSSQAFQFHPLVNTATLIVSKADIERFVELTGHELKIVDVPGHD